LGLELACLLLYRGEKRGPVGPECARPMALETFGESIDVDTGVGDCRDGPLRRRIVGL
jgi:hypothetical protein